MSTAAKKTTACAAYLKCIAALHEQAVRAVGNVSKVRYRVECDRGLAGKQNSGRQDHDDPAG